MTCDNCVVERTNETKQNRVHLAARSNELRCSACYGRVYKPDIREGQYSAVLHREERFPVRGNKHVSCVARAVSTVVVGALMRSEVQHKAGQRAEEAINCSYHVASGCEVFASSTFIILFFAYQSIFSFFLQPKQRGSFSPPCEEPKRSAISLPCL